MADSVRQNLRETSVTIATAPLSHCHLQTHSTSGVDFMTLHFYTVAVVLRYVEMEELLLSRAKDRERGEREGSFLIFISFSGWNLCVFMASMVASPFLSG